MAKILLGEMTREEAKERLRGNIAILPVGSLEQHGPHLPLDTDSFDAFHLSVKAVERVSDPKPIVLPSINYGVSYHHMGFPGTISISPETLIKMVYEICEGLANHGVKRIVIVNGHGGNNAALTVAAQKVRYHLGIPVYLDAAGSLSKKERKEIVKTKGNAHSGEYETSTSLANRPHLVQLEKAKEDIPKFKSKYLDYDAEDRVIYPLDMKEMTKHGILGDATKASKAKGKKLWEAMTSNLAEFLEDLKVMG